MNIKKLVKNVKEAQPTLKNVPDEDAKRLLQQVFKGILEEIEATPEGLVRVPKLGNFTIRNAEREREGRKVQVRRIAFRPSKGRAA
jgi:hypothetical protein